MDCRAWPLDIYHDGIVTGCLSACLLKSVIYSEINCLPGKTVMLHIDELLKKREFIHKM